MRVSSFEVVLKVEESLSGVQKSNIFQKGLLVTNGTILDVLEESSLELVSFENLHVCVQFLSDFSFDNILVSEQFSNFVFANWLSLFVSPMQSLCVVSIIVFLFEVGFLRELSKISLGSVANHIINNLRLNGLLIGFALEHVPQSSHFLEVHGGKERHYLFEFLLVMFVLLDFSFDRQIGFADLTNKLFTLSVKSL